MKLFKASIILQILFCIGFIIAIVSFSLHDAFNNTSLGDICSDISRVSAIVTFQNPMGLVGIVLNWVAFLETELKKSTKALVWSIASTILVTASWLATCLLLVHYIFL